MEVTICLPKAPDVPSLPERQPTKLPDAGAAITTDDRKRLRRAVFAGLTSTAAGTLGSPNVAKPTLGA